MSAYTLNPPPPPPPTKEDLCMNVIFLLENVNDKKDLKESMNRHCFLWKIFGDLIME